MVNIKRKLDALVGKLKEEWQEDYETDISRITREAVRRGELERAIVTLNSAGCSYRKKGVGCFHCGHLRGYENPQDLFQQFISDVDRLEKRDEIFVYSNGSFFDPLEINPDIQIGILKHLADLGFERVVVESRPDVISEEIIKQAKQVIGHDRLYVGLGFDTYDDEIRDLCLNRGFSRRDYDHATTILRSEGVTFETRVVVKPPFLTEKEGIEEAVKTVDYAFEKGTDSVSLEPIALQRHTLQDYLHNRERYRVPWLWSIISILDSTRGKGKILFGGETFYPAPYETAHNCSKCTGEVKQVFYNFNVSQNFQILKDLSCNCKTIWKNQLDVKENSLYTRIHDALK